MDYEILSLDWIFDEHSPVKTGEWSWSKTIVAAQKAISNTLLDWVIVTVSKSLNETKKWPWPKSIAATKKAILDVLSDIDKEKLDKIVEAIDYEKFDENPRIYTHLIAERMGTKEKLPILWQWKKEDIGIASHEQNAIWNTLFYDYQTETVYSLQWKNSLDWFIHKGDFSPAPYTGNNQITLMRKIIAEVWLSNLDKRIQNDRDLTIYRA